MRIHGNLYSRRSVYDDFNILTDSFEGFDYSNPKVSHGKGSGSSGSTNSTVTSSSTPPPQIMAAYQQALSGAQTASSAPLQQYSGPTVAGFTPDQTQAFNTVDQSQGVANPFINSASQLINQGTQPLWNNVQQFSPDNVNQYMSPYTGQVLNSAVAQQQNTDAQQQQALKGNAVSSGAWGGDRAGVASAVLSGQQDLANNQTNAGILNQGYTQGLGEFNTQQQAQLGANEANQYLAQQGAFGMGNLGNEAQSTALSGASAQLQSGAIQQQLGQEALNVPYQNFLQQQAYPFQTGQYYANIAEGLGGASGGTSSTTSPAPSTASQLGGLGLGGLGLIGGMSSKGSSARGGRIYQRGGQVRHLASGGISNDIATGVPDLSISFIPSTTPSRGGGPPAAPRPYNAPNSTPSASSLASAGKGLGSLINMLPSSGGSLSAMGGSSALDPDSSSAVDMSGESNPMDFLSSGSFGADAASSGAGDAAASGSIGDAAGSLFSSFRRGGATGAFGSPRHYSDGGNTRSGLGTEIGGGIGGVIGSIYGPIGSLVGHAAGMDFGSAVDDGVSGDWGSNGVLGDLEVDANPNHLMSAKYIKRGGRIHFDDGGMVGGQQPLTDQIQGMQQPTAAARYNTMTPQQLQNYLIRLPPGSPQSQQIQQVLQQKKMMPNVGTPATGGLGTQQQGTGMMARGGVPHGYATDGSVDDSIPDPPTPAQLAVQQDVAGEDAMSGAAPGGMGSIPAPPSVAQPSAVQPVASEKPPADTSEPRTEREKVNPWLSLAAAGFAMAGGESPYAGVNAGRGALAGLQDYASQRKEVDNVNQAADKMLAEAKQHRDDLAIQQQNADTNKMNAGTTAQFRSDSVAQQKADLAQKTQFDAAQVANMNAERQKPIPDGVGGFLIPNPQDPAHPSRIDAPAGGGKMSDANLTFMAQQYLAGDKSVVNGLGYGKVGAVNRVALRDAIQQEATNVGLSPADVAEKLADYQGTVAEQRTIGQRTGNVRVGAEAVNGAADMALKSSAAIDRTQYPSINAVNQAILQGTGDPAITDFMVKHNTLINEYAAAQNPRGVPRVADKDHARDILDTAFSQGQYEAGVNAIKQEIGNIQKATKNVRGGGDQQGNNSAAAQIPPPDQRVKGQSYTNPNGVTKTWTGTGWQ
jgi:hypothetical protein